MADERTKQREERRAAAEQQVKEGEEKRQRIVADTEQGLADAQPTPTQRENDEAKLGIFRPGDRHEESGGETDRTRTMSAAPSGGAGTYQTRETARGRTASAPAATSAPTDDKKPA